MQVERMKEESLLSSRFSGERVSQQQQNDQILKDLFGVNGVALQELKAAIAGLQKGELITKDATNMALGLGKHWKKIKVTHLI